MHIQIVGKGIKLSEALRERITDRVTEGVDKYSDRPGEAHITVRKNNHEFEVNCSLHLASGAMFQTHGQANDAYIACENTLIKLEKRLRRYKRRMKNHHNAQKQKLPVEEAYFYVIESTTHNTEDPLEKDMEAFDEETEEKAPAIIAEHPGELRTLTVGMAVQEMDLTNAPVLVFRNAAHGRINVVLRRADGHIGWVDPDHSDTESL